MATERKADLEKQKKLDKCGECEQRKLLVWQLVWWALDIQAERECHP